METFWITFRIKNDAGYQARYGALIDAVKAHNSGRWWFEPTSFWLLHSNSSRDNLAASIKRVINVKTDLVLIGSMEHLGATLIGTADELADLRLLVPALQIA